MATKQIPKSPETISQATDKRSARETFKAILTAPFDQTFFDWMAHGSTEVANMVLHGHAAPVYSRSSTPAPAEADTSTQNAAEMQLAALAPTVDSVATVSDPSVLDKHLPQPANNVPLHSERSLVTSHGAIDKQSTSIVDKHLPDPSQLIESPQHEHELGR